MSKYKAKIREEELKHKVAADWFAAYDCTRIVGNIDFTVDIPAFTESEIGARERFASHFMTEFMAGKQCRRDGLHRVEKDVATSTDAIGTIASTAVTNDCGAAGVRALPGSAEQEGDDHSPTPTQNSNFNQQLTTTNQQQ